MFFKILVFIILIDLVVCDILVGGGQINFIRGRFFRLRVHKCHSMCTIYVQNFGHV